MPEFPAPREVASTERAAAIEAQSAEGQVRPKIIVYFERIIFGTFLLSAVQSYLSWAAVSHRNSAAFAIMIWIFSFVLAGTLTLLVSRRRNKIAMRMLIAHRGGSRFTMNTM
jgi:hypothetical protein